MKKLIIAIISAIILTGCTQFNSAMDIIDIFVPDPAPAAYHQAKVESVTIGSDKKIIFFQDGYNFEVDNYIDVKPGDTVSIFQEDDGSFTAKVD